MAHSAEQCLEQAERQIFKASNYHNDSEIYLAIASAWQEQARLQMKLAE